MSEKTLKLDNIEANKKEFHAFKQAVGSNLVDINKIVISEKFKLSNKGFEYFIGYKDDNIARPLCIILPQKSGYISFFGNRGKNMSFMIEDDSVLIKYNEIWDKIKKTLNITIPSMPVYDGKYIKAKVKEFNRVVNTNFLSDRVPKEGVHHTCKVCLSNDSKLYGTPCHFSGHLVF